jgi:quercetin dioxygenase-like cupin family protein
LTRNLRGVLFQPIFSRTQRAVEETIVRPGKARRASLRTSPIDFLATAKQSNLMSLFEFNVAPGFGTGAHYYTKIEEFFYLLEGELELRAGNEVVRAKPGTLTLVLPALLISSPTAG